MASIFRWSAQDNVKRFVHTNYFDSEALEDSTRHYGRASFTLVSKKNTSDSSLVVLAIVEKVLYLLLASLGACNVLHLLVHLFCEPHVMK